MKKTILIIYFLLSLNLLFSQVDNNKFNYSIGFGSVLAGKGNLLTIVENQINYNLNNYFSLSLNVDNGRSFGYSDEVNDFFQFGSNIFISPLKNIRQNNLKIGLGLAEINETVTNKVFVYNNTKYEKFYNVVKNASIGYNFIIEYEYKINSHYLIGGKLFTTGKFSDRSLFVGGLIKFGILL